jgi:molybdopterin/thiamine biosynthesis adenylyltransferase
MLLFEQAPRLLADYRELLALAAEVDWLAGIAWRFTDTGDVCVNFDVSVQARVYEAVLVFPPLYPDTPAFVRPRNRTERWSAHQYPGTGTLCLEWGPDNWRADVTAADLVRSTHKLLSYESAGIGLSTRAPTRHSLTLGQQLRGAYCRLYCPQAVRDRVLSAAGPLAVEISTLTSFRFLEQVAFIERVGEASVPQGSTDLPPEPAVSSGWYRRLGWILRVDEFTSLAGELSVGRVEEFLHAKGHTPPWPPAHDRSAFLLLVDAANALRSLVVAGGETQTVFEYRLFEGAAEQKRRPAEHACLTSKKVAIVGLGSVGSKVAASLARSGVGSFVLVDDDVLLPDNLVRHQLDWTSVGFSKAEATGGAIHLVAPTAQVSVRVQRLAGQENAASNTAALEAIAACDVIIDATADAHVFAPLAAICRRRKRALLWGEVFAGGIGGMMARSVPGRDADALAVRDAISGYFATLPEAPFGGAQGYDDAPDSQGPLVASDAAVSQLAASLTQFALDALIERDPPAFPYAAYLFGYAQAWVFEGPFDTRPIRCPPAPAEPQAATEDHLAAIRELITLFPVPEDADSQPAA